MLITSRAGDFVELRVDAYQYGKSPSSRAGGWDENWLIISGHVASGAESWRFRDPCLTTWEARDLLAWLRRAAATTPAPIEFTEPNLSFAATPGTPTEMTIDVTFRGEAAPPSISEGNRWSVGSVLSLDLSSDSLRDAAEAWELEIANYPIR